jgi:hypothetical protein
MDRKSYYKYLFLIGAAWNILASLSFIFTSIFNLSAFPAYGIAVPISMIWLQSFLFLVANLGIGYFIVSMDISKNHGIVIIGVIAKLGYFLICVIYLIIGDIGILTLLFASVDVIFAVLFIEFLINYKKL